MGEPSPGADVAGVSPVPVQMWQSVAHVVQVLVEGPRELDEVCLKPAHPHRVVQHAHGRLPKKPLGPVAT